MLLCVGLQGQVHSYDSAIYPWEAVKPCHAVCCHLLEEREGHEAAQNLLTSWHCGEERGTCTSPAWDEENAYCGLSARTLHFSGTKKEAARDHGLETASTVLLHGESC